MKIAIYPYKRNSESATALAEHTEGRIVYDISTVRSNEILVNWGAGYLPGNGWRSSWLNKPHNICHAIYKLDAFELFSRTGVPHPTWTRNQETAQNWLRAGNIVLARQTSSGYMGAGITVYDPEVTMVTLPSAEFYSKHIRHDDEYRIHVFRGRVVNIGKKFAYGTNANPLVRNWGSWRFSNPSSAPTCVKQVGIDAVRSLGLDFGAADIGYLARQDKAYAFEVNTAPGTGHNTITQYANAIITYVETL